MTKKRTAGGIKYASLEDYIWGARVTATVVADRLGISKQYLSAIRSGRQTPSLSVALRIADLTGCDVRTLVAKDGR